MSFILESQAFICPKSTIPLFQYSTIPLFHASFTIHDKGAPKEGSWEDEKTDDGRQTTDDMPQLFVILVIVIWNLFGIWDLGFGISSGGLIDIACFFNEIASAGYYSPYITKALQGRGGKKMENRKIGR